MPPPDLLASGTARKEAPVIETARLRLRGHAVADFENCLAMWSDPEVVRSIGGKPFQAEEVWARLLRYAGHWALLGFGFWLIEETDTRQFVGEVGFADYKRAIETSLQGLPEIGWALAASSHGRGYATEAVAAAVAWGDLHLGSPHTMCMIRPANLASIRVAEKCGYTEFERAAYKDQPTVLFRR